MKKKLFVLLAVIVVLSVLPTIVLATPPDSVHGRWCYTIPVEGEHKIAGKNEFYDIYSSDAWLVDEGFLGFSGFSESYGSMHIQLPSGPTMFQAETFLDPVTVAGKTGTLEMRVTGRIPKGGGFPDYEGKWVITNGTGELVGLRGQGSWQNVEFYHPDCLELDEGFIASVTYEGSIHFEE